LSTQLSGIDQNPDESAPAEHGDVINIVTTFAEHFFEMTV